MKKTWTMAALAALVAACGGSGSNRVTKSFTYGTPAPATGESLGAADSVEGGVTSATQFKLSSGEAAATAGASVVALPDAMESALDATSIALRASAGSAEASVERVTATAAARLVGDTGSVLLSPGCFTVTATSVKYDNCKATVDDPNANFVVTLNGSITKNGDEVKWDLTATLSGAGTSSTGSIGVDAKVHYFGDLTVTATSLNGFAESDKSISASSAGQRITIAWTTSADFEHLTFTDSCITGGSLELKRIWTQKPSSGTFDPSQLQDRALKLDWQGCGTVLVSRSL